jgi:spermidine synthase
LALLSKWHSGPGGLRIGVVGLGAGTLAAYGQPGDYFRFYEIDPDVIRLAERYFSFMRDSAALVEVVSGDARISMERELEQNRPQRFDVLAVDAFTGGAIPVHLLTREALGVYLRHLEPAEGILAVHISNDAVDLRPVLAALGRYFRLSQVFVESWPTEDGCRSSSWVLIARSPRALSQPAIEQVGSPLADSDPSLLWTDDYSNLFRVLRH